MITKRYAPFAQGEISGFRCEGEMPDGLVEMTQRDKMGRPIISHSESGSHHVLERATRVMEDPNPPEGMRILYALLEQPTALIQDASDAHGSHMLEPGLYEYRIAREFDPFSAQARMVAD